MIDSDLDACAIRINDGVQRKGSYLDRWTSYTFTSDFLTPADSFHFTIGDPEYVTGVSGAIAEGLNVSLMVNGTPICTGMIDEVAMGADRSGGTVFECSGRDILGDVIDSCVDPYVTFTPQDTLETIIATVMKPFGITTIDEDNAANRSIKTANAFGYKTTPPPVRGKKIKVVKGGGGPTKRFVQYQAKPYPGEGAYEFCHRLAKRAGLHIWAKADGSGVVIGKPDYKQEPAFTLTRKVTGERNSNGGEKNNILSGFVKYSRTNQPSLIIAGAKGGGGDFPRTTLRVIMVNEVIARQFNGELVDSVKDFLKKWNGKAYVMSDADFEGEGKMPRSLSAYPLPRPLYMVDQEANNLEQLKNFVKREMASRQMQALEVHYEVAGHTQDGKIWSTDTMAQVDDDVANLHEPLWVKSVTFSKNRSSGTKTSLTLIRPNTLRL